MQNLGQGHLHQDLGGLFSAYREPCYETGHTEPLLTYAGVDPEQPLVLDTLEQLPEVPGCPGTGTVGPEVGPEDLEHGLPAGGVGGGAGLGLTVHAAGLLVPLQALPAVVVVPAGVGQAVAGGQVLLPAGPVLWVLGTGRVEDTLGPVTLVVSPVLPAGERGEGRSLGGRVSGNTGGVRGGTSGTQRVKI